MVGQKVRVEVFKHYRSESIALDNFETTLTQSPDTAGHSANNAFVLGNIFNSHTILNKRYSFNSTKDELKQAYVELRFYHDDYYIGNVEVRLDTVVDNFRGTSGTYSLANKGRPSPFLVDLMIHPVDILDH
mmetsp:Transcript_7752/g.6772  ORF Transcript_7752/g.6772 Transcript_7752/m.6772 type:complete len:131 (-) Transcript_7752:2119-2511(-)